MFGIVVHTALLFMPDRSVQPHDPGGDNAVDLLCGFLLAGFDVFCGIDLRDYTSRHPSKDRIAAVDTDSARRRSASRLWAKETSGTQDQ